MLAFPKASIIIYSPQKGLKKLKKFDEKKLKEAIESKKRCGNIISAKPFR